MILSHSRRFVFVHIPKTAGEAITRTLAPHLGRDDIYFSGQASRELHNAYYRQRYALRKHSKARDIATMLSQADWDGYFKFTIVRHPVDRARSLYHFYEKMHQNRRPLSVRGVLWRLPGLSASDPHTWPGMTAYLQSGSFSQFIRHPAFGSVEPATRPQTDMLADENGALMVDFVGKFETLDSDFARIAERIGLPGVRLGVVNTSRNRTEQLPVSAPDRAYLADLYHRDFAAFGYEP